MKVLTIVGNRPQFIKLGVTARRLRQLGDNAPFTSVVVNTGQHYDQMLSDVFFSELEIEPPQYNLGMGSGHIVDQIGRMLAPLREIFERERPDAMLVYGDTNSTIAGAIVAAHLGVPAIHVEGGERLYRRLSMPEEVNRVVTDHLSELCLASSRKAVRYLRREGFAPSRVKFVGDPMYDIFKLSGEMLETRDSLQPGDFGLEPNSYGLCTIHRAENTDERDVCLALLTALDEAHRPILLPAHPRLRARLEAWHWQPHGSLRLIDPLGYFDFQSLLRQCAVAVTDSGGVGREAFFAGKPAIIPLESSAWVEAVEAGMAVMTGRSGARLAAALAEVPGSRDVAELINHEFGNGDAGRRIVDEVASHVGSRADGGEGIWHQLTTFENLPRATDASDRSHRAFSLLAAQAVAEGWPAERLLLDVTRSLMGATELVQLARKAGAAFTIVLDPSAAGYNPFADENLQLIRQLAGPAPIAATDARGAALLRAALGHDVATVNFAETSAPTANGSVEPDCQIRIEPWLWAKVPVMPLESGLRTADSALEAALAKCRTEAQA